MVIDAAIDQNMICNDLFIGSAEYIEGRLDYIPLKEPELYLKTRYLILKVCFKASPILGG